MSIRHIVISIVVVLTSFSCQRSSPQIDELQWRLLYRDTGVYRYEELAIFVRASDRDGPEDLEQITVSAGNTGLIWRFSANEWIKDIGMEEEGAWIGLPAVIPLEGFSLPEELYTLTLEDRTGRDHQITFRPDPNRLRMVEIKWPQARIENGFFLLEEPYEEGTLIFRNEDLALNQVLQVANETAIDVHESAHWWELWIPLPERTSGFRLGPFPLQTTGSESSL
ncbi:hypothetical protein S1OALGB6SA_617 [Olavius algarvensis spirochete endosymbiont]|uniref:hypothetical protein n=1 Tax=Olavius algarvensis spirochete endosymbiont TaxID=260710 RepID=UPI00052DAA71|nr:hypothetical protein [Olavius algarvensis spirochete endosymbiont]KGM43442.1 hypothetical protein JY97_07250 [Alkalispirochaeta odontotermitis]VDA99548.1 hypothetical protein S1OALGB6SA_617 [Olavius algarvensis spirochete endosymbiont]